MRRQVWALITIGLLILVVEVGRVAVDLYTDRTVRDQVRDEAYEIRRDIAELEQELKTTEIRIRARMEELIRDERNRDEGARRSE